jgi:hypothetical protein
MFDDLAAMMGNFATQLVKSGEVATANLPI